MNCQCLICKDYKDHRFFDMAEETFESLPDIEFNEKLDEFERAWNDTMTKFHPEKVFKVERCPVCGASEDNGWIFSSCHCCGSSFE